MQMRPLKINKFKLIGNSALKEESSKK